MTKEKAKELIILLSAYLEDKIIQVSNNGEHWVEFNMVSPEYIFEYCYHRIKPEPKLVPFTFEDREMFRDKWIRRKTDGCEFCPNEIYSKSVNIQTNNCVNYSDLLDKYEFLDGSPCGKYIDEEL